MNDIIIKSYYYIIKVTDGIRLYYKIGETTKNKKRPEALIEKYTALKRVSAEIIAFEELPNNGTKRLNDKTIHKNVSELTPADPYAIKGMLNQEEDGINEFFQTTKSDTKLVEYVKDVVSKLAQDDSNFKTKIKTLDNMVLNYSGQKQTHKVNSDLIDKIENFVGLKLYKEELKNILLVGQFEPDWIATFTLENTVYILHDSKDEKHIYAYKKLNDKIVYLNELKEVIDMEIKFDYIISNPPYSIGNQITKAIVDNVEFNQFVNLMPASKYKAKELYKHVKYIEPAEDTFEDAAVGDSLTLSVLEKDAAVFEDYDSLNLYKTNPVYREFYKLNGRCVKTYDILPNMLNKYDIKENKCNFNPVTDFMITTRTTQNGVHKTDAWDIHFNLNNEFVATLSYMIRPKNKTNLCRFWYHNPLMNDLIKGLNKTSGDCYTAIPNIDWSKERDYEHLTLDDIMNILKEENPNVD